MKKTVCKAILIACFLVGFSSASTALASDPLQDQAEREQMEKVVVEKVKGFGNAMMWIGGTLVVISIVGYKVKKSKEAEARKRLKNL